MADSGGRGVSGRAPRPPWRSCYLAPWGHRSQPEADPSRSETVRGVAEAAASSSMRSCVDGRGGSPAARRAHGDRIAETPVEHSGFKLPRPPQRVGCLRRLFGGPHASHPPIKVAGRACEPGRQSPTRKSAEGFLPLMRLECGVLTGAKALLRRAQRKDAVMRTEAVRLLTARLLESLAGPHGDRSAWRSRAARRLPCRAPTSTGRTARGSPPSTRREHKAIVYASRAPRAASPANGRGRINN